MSESARALGAIFGHGSIYSIGTLLRVASGILVLPILTRILDPAEYGIVATAIIVQSLLGVIVAAGIPTALVRSFYFDEEGPAGARTLVWATLGIAVAVTLLADVTGPLWSQIFSSIEYGTGLRVAVWTAVPVAVLASIQSVLRSEKRPVAFVVTIGVMSLGAQAVGTAVAAVDGSAAGYLVGFGVAHVVALTVGLLLIRGQVERPTLGLMGRALRVGLPVVPHGLALFVLTAGDRVVVENFEGLDAVGRYQLAYIVGSLGFFVLHALNQAWAPVVYETDERGRWSVLSETTATLSLLAALLAGALGLTAPVALGLIAPPDYELDTLGSVTALVAASVVPMTMYLGFFHAVLQVGRTGSLMVITPLVAALNIGLNLILIPEIGLEGAAIATLFAYSLQALLFGLACRRIVTVPWRVRRAMESLALVGALVALALVQPSGGGWNVVRLVEGAALLAAGGLIVMRKTRHPANADDSPGSGPGGPPGPQGPGS